MDYSRRSVGDFEVLVAGLHEVSPCVLLSGKEKAMTDPDVQNFGDASFTAGRFVVAVAEHGQHLEEELRATKEGLDTRHLAVDSALRRIQEQVLLLKTLWEGKADIEGKLHDTERELDGDRRALDDVVHKLSGLVDGLSLSFIWVSVSIQLAVRRLCADDLHATPSPTKRFDRR